MNKFKIFTLTLFAVILSASTFAQSVDEVNKKFNEAAELVNKKEYAKAIPALESVIAMGEKVPDALPTIEKAQKLLPQLYITMANRLATEKKFDQALEFGIKAAERAELNGDLASMNRAKTFMAKVYTVLGTAEFNAKNYVKAAELFSKGFEIAPNNTQLTLFRAKCYGELGEVDKTIEAYSQIIDLEKRDATKFGAAANKAKTELAYYMLQNAVKAASEGNYDNVVKFTDVIFAFNPKDANAQLVKLQTANNLKRYKEVTEFGKAAAEAQTTPEKKSEAYFLLGSAFDNLQMKDKAIDAYKLVVAGPYVETAKKQIVELSKEEPAK